MAEKGSNSVPLDHRNHTKSSLSEQKQIDFDQLQLNAAFGGSNDSYDGISTSTGHRKKLRKEMTAEEKKLDNLRTRQRNKKAKASLEQEPLVESNLNVPRAPDVEQLPTQGAGMKTGPRVRITSRLPENERAAARRRETERRKRKKAEKRALEAGIDSAILSHTFNKPEAQSTANQYGTSWPQEKQNQPSQSDLYRQNNQRQVVQRGKRNEQGVVGINMTGAWDQGYYGGYREERWHGDYDYGPPNQKRPLLASAGYNDPYYERNYGRYDNYDYGGYGDYYQEYGDYYGEPEYGDHSRRLIPPHPIPPADQIAPPKRGDDEVVVMRKSELDTMIDRERARERERLPQASTSYDPPNRARSLSNVACRETTRDNVAKEFLREMLRENAGEFVQEKRQKQQKEEQGDDRGAAALLKELLRSRQTQRPSQTHEESQRYVESRRVATTIETTRIGSLSSRNRYPMLEDMPMSRVIEIEDVTVTAQEVPNSGSNVLNEEIVDGKEGKSRPAIPVEPGDNDSNMNGENERNKTLVNQILQLFSSQKENVQENTTLVKNSIFTSERPFSYDDFRQGSSRSTVHQERVSFELTVDPYSRYATTRPTANATTDAFYFSSPAVTSSVPYNGPLKKIAKKYFNSAPNNVDPDAHASVSNYSQIMDQGDIWRPRFF